MVYLVVFLKSMKVFLNEDLIMLKNYFYCYYKYYFVFNKSSKKRKKEKIVGYKFMFFVKGILV